MNPDNRSRHCHFPNQESWDLRAGWSSCHGWHGLPSFVAFGKLSFLGAFAFRSPQDDVPELNAQPQHNSGSAQLECSQPHDIRV